MLVFLLRCLWWRALPRQQNLSGSDRSGAEGWLDRGITLYCLGICIPQEEGHPLAEMVSFPLPLHLGSTFFSCSPCVGAPESHR